MARIDPAGSPGSDGASPYQELRLLRGAFPYGWVIVRK
jgi:hypothetical protein